MKHTSYPVAGLIFFTLAACHKDDAPRPIQPPSCVVTKALIYKNREVVDSAVYEFDKDTLRQVKQDLQVIRFIYNGKQLTRRDFITNGNTLATAYDTVYYGTNGFPEKLEHYALRFGVWEFDLQYKFEFVYTNGMLSNISHSQVQSGTWYKIKDQHFTYSGTNIIRNDVLLYNSPSNPIATYYTYAYNSKATPVPAVTRQNLFRLFGFDWDNYLLPVFLSTNMMTEASIQTSKRPVNYVMDAQNNVQSVDDGIYPNNFPIMGFSYSCP